MGEPVYGAPLPDQPRKRWYMVKSPKGHQKRRITFLMESFIGFWVHWDGAVVPCCNTHSCERCASGKSNRWQAYVAAWDLVSHERCVEAITEGQARTLLNMRHPETGLRGVSVEMWRKFPTKANSSVIVKKIGYQRSEDCFEAHPIMDSLNRLFGLNERFVARAGQNLPPEFDVVEDVPLPQVEEVTEPTRPTEKDTPARRGVPVNPTDLARRWELPGD